MATSITGPGITLNLATLSKPTNYSSSSSPKPFSLNAPWRRSTGFATTSRRAARFVSPVKAAAPDNISEKVVESIKSAEETCSDDPASGECVAAWDEVEELSAAASHARDKKKGTDPLEEYCKDNPEVVECRTYED